MKKQLSCGLLWTTYFLNPHGKKVYDREGINQIISEYYTMLYDDSNGKCNSETNTFIGEEP